MRLKEVVLAAATLVATASGRPGLFLHQQDFPGVVGMGKHRRLPASEEDVLHHNVDDNANGNGRAFVSGAFDQPRTDPEVVYDPRVSRAGTRAVPHNAFIGEPGVKSVEEPTETFAEEPGALLIETFAEDPVEEPMGTSVDEPVVYLIETPVEEPVEVLIEIPIGTLFEGPDEGPVEIYVEVPQGMTLEVVPGEVEIEHPVEEPLHAPTEAATVAAIEVSPQVEREVISDKRPEAHTISTVVEGKVLSFAEDFPDQPETSHLPLLSVVPVEAKAIGIIPADVVSETVSTGKDMLRSNLLSENAARDEESSDADDGKNTMLQTDTDLPQVNKTNRGKAIRGTARKEVQKVEEPLGEDGSSMVRLGDTLSAEAVGGVSVEGEAVQKRMTDKDTSTLGIFKEDEIIMRIHEDDVIHGPLFKEASGEEAPFTGKSPQDAEGKNKKAIDTTIAKRRTKEAASSLPEGTANETTVTKTAATKEDSDDAAISTGAPNEEPQGTTLDNRTSKDPHLEMAANVMKVFPSPEALNDDKDPIEDPSNSVTRTFDQVDPMMAVKRQHATKSLAVRIPVNVVREKSGQFPVERMTGMDDGQSVDTSQGIDTADTEGLGDVEVAVHLRGEEFPEEGVPLMEDAPEKDVRSDDDESRPAPRLWIRPRPSRRATAVVPSVLRKSYKYYPGIPVHKQKRKLPRGFLLLPYHV